jgi:hypothetical protein
MSSQQQNPIAGATQWSSLKKTKKGPTKISAIKKMEVGLTDDSNRLKDPVVIAITCGDYSQQLVLHRPVGASKLLPSDWVLTPISEVEPLLAFAVDPAKEKKDAAKRKLRLDTALALGLYIKDKDVICFPATCDQRIAGKPITSFNVEAQRLHDEAKKAAHDSYLSECEASGKKPKKDWKFGQTVNHFLPKEVKDYEETVRKKTAENPSYKDGLKKIEPVPYETMAGPFQDRPQSALHGSGRIDFSKEQMVDQVKKHLVNTMSGGYNFPIAPPKTMLDTITSGAKDPAKQAEIINASLFGATKPVT